MHDFFQNTIKVEGTKKTEQILSQHERVPHIGPKSAVLTPKDLANNKIIKNGYFCN